MECTSGQSGRLRVRCRIGQELVAEASFEFTP
jgi:hypothetical protein